MSYNIVWMSWLFFPTNVPHTCCFTSQSVWCLCLCTDNWMELEFWGVILLDISSYVYKPIASQRLEQYHFPPWLEWSTRLFKWFRWVWTTYSYHLVIRHWYFKITHQTKWWIFQFSMIDCQRLVPAVKLFMFSRIAQHFRQRFSWMQLAHVTRITQPDGVVIPNIYLKTRCVFYAFFCINKKVFF